MITALEIPELNGKEKTAYHFNELEQPLLSILVLADDGCAINLSSQLRTILW